MRDSLRLRTARLELIASNRFLARADASDRASLALQLGATVPTEWPPPLTADHVEQFAELFESGAWTPGFGPWYWVLDESHRRTLIGNGGFGPPDPSGRLVMGYAVLDEFQRRGFATEACRSLLGWAFSHSHVTEVVGDTYPELEGSIKVMRACGMEFVGPGPEPRTIRHRITRAAHDARSPA